MSQTNADEVDLGVVFTKIKESFTNFLISLYNGIQFIIKNWLIIILLIIAGVVTGYLLSKSKKHTKETTIIVQNNFNSSSYVYSAIEQLNNKLGDTLYLKENGFISESVIKGIEIDPIVNMNELLDKTAYNYRAIEPLLEKADFEDELLTSEVFYEYYSLHKIVLETTFEGNEQTINSLLKYLNNNEKFNKIKLIAIGETKNNINEQNTTILGINNVIKAFYSKSDIAKADQIYISTGNNVTDLGLLLEKKTAAIKKREQLKVDLVKYNEIVTVINNPSLYKKSTIIKLNSKTMPFLFVVLFLLFSYSRYKFLKIKKLAESKNSKSFLS